MKKLAFNISFRPLAAGLAAFLLPAANLHAADQPRSDADNGKKPQFVFISGEVKIPQRYIYTNGMTVGGAIQMAKGVTAQASPNVDLNREGQKPITLSREAIEKNKTKDVELKPGDTVFVPHK